MLRVSVVLSILRLRGLGQSGLEVETECGRHRGAGQGAFQEGSSR